MARARNSRLNPADRRARDRLIRAEHEEGATLEALAQRFGVSVATVKRAIARARTISAEEQLDGLDPHDDLLAILDAQRRALATCVCEMESGDSSSARVGAAKATVSIGESIRDTLASSGKLPGRIVNPPSMGDSLALDREWNLRQSYVRGEFTSPKSRRGVRSVPLADELAGELERHFRDSAFQGDDDLALAHPRTGRPLDRSKVRKRFKEAVKRAGVREVRFHDLRHSFGTRMASVGVPMRTLQEWLGHRDFATTLVYADYAPSDQEREWVEAAFARGRLVPPAVPRTEIRGYPINDERPT